jgi:hypothetical protein
MRSLLFVVVVALCLASGAAEPVQRIEADVCVYGGTASGMMAGIATARAGKSVVVVEPSRWLGGMVGGGLRVAIDCKYPRDIGGLTKMMLEHDAAIGGEGPHEKQWAFRELFKRLASEHGIIVLYEHRLGAVDHANGVIRALRLDYAPPEKDGCPIAEPMTIGAAEVRAKVFIDATYEGDLMAGVGVAFAVGRESRDTYNESLAGVRNPRVFDLDPYIIPGEPSSGILPMIDPEPMGPLGAASPHTMAYNFRLQFVPAGEGRALGAPADPVAARYALVRRALEIDRKLIGWPNGNYNRGAVISSGIPGRQSDYPNANWRERAAIWREWIEHVKIMHAITGSDAALKPGEYPDSDDFPSQLYIRLARRMLGEYVMTQHDLAHETTIPDSIGLGFYFVDIYPCRLIVANGKVATEGETNELVSPGPYPIAYRALTPKRAQCRNLLVSVCVSASHVALASMRMEPTYMIMGEAAGIAAARAIDENAAVQDIDWPHYEAALTEAGQILRWDGQSYEGFKRGWQRWKEQQDQPGGGE